MKLIQFPEQTSIYAEDQPQYEPLPAHVFRDDPSGKIAFCWKLTLKERLLLLFSGKLWHQVLTFSHPLQPQMISLAKPKMKSRFPFRAWTCFRLCVTWCIQAQGAPFADPSTVTDFTGRKFRGYCFVINFFKMHVGKLTHWRHPRLWLQTPQPMAALVIAWEVEQKPAGTPVPPQTEAAA